MVPRLGCVLQAIGRLEVSRSGSYFMYHRSRPMEDALSGGPEPGYGERGGSCAWLAAEDSGVDQGGGAYVPPVTPGVCNISPRWISSSQRLFPEC